MNAMISLSDLHVIDDEPRIHDLRLAEALGFGRVYDIRQLIQRNSGELVGFGEVYGTVPKTSRRGGRPTTEYHLNEAQALLICMFSQTRRAAEVRKQLIEVFMAWRRGELTQPVQPASTDPRNDAFRRMSARLEVIEQLLSFTSRQPAASLSVNITYLPVWSNGRRPVWWGDSEVRAFLTASHRQIPIKAVRAEMLKRFDAERVPSASSIHRYWMVLDQARGLSRAN